MNSLDIKQLLPELKKLVTFLAEDLLKRVNADTQINNGLKEAFHQIEKGGRTAQAYEVWLEDYLDQVAVAWVLACVFVRFMEDNGLIDECWLAGEGERRRLAEDAQTLYFREHPHDSDREYFQHIFHEVGKIPAAADLFAEGKTPLWAVAPSGDAAMTLLKFWREMNLEAGTLKRPFQVANGDTRFLGDLYQDLSERAKKKYALLQTPVFVEEFILDRTLVPALAEFGLEQLRMIDPTCGSGHFLLGGFARFFREWCKRESNEIKAAQMALDGVWGVDINPFAVAIARFRLIVAALQACGIDRLKQAPGWHIHLATGDSLLLGSRWDSDGTKRAEARYLDDSWAPDIYACEDKDMVKEVLGQQYHAVVGNPPYIIPSDKTLNKAYRTRYPQSCFRQYSLAVPFTERFIDLALSAVNGGSGYVGMITANSFMKHAFGKRLIENFLPQIDLTHVIDTKDAFIPGHTTSTVILLARNRRPVANVVRAVLGIKGEAETPLNPAEAPVWSSIVSNVDRIGVETEYVSVCDLPRSSLSQYPWNIGGGGAADLKTTLDKRGELTVGDIASSVGFFQDTHADEVFVQPRGFVKRFKLEFAFRPHVRGDDVRDWHAADDEMILFPYASDAFIQWDTFPLSDQWSWLFCQRTGLWNRRTFDGNTYLSSGRPWYDYHQFPKDRARSKTAITFAEIATHNHFAFHRNTSICNRTAPIITLGEGTSEGRCLALLALLNSSTFCFWAKQIIPCKGLGGQGGGIKPETWSRAYVFNGSAVSRFPIPKGYETLHSFGTMCDDLAQKIMLDSPDTVVQCGVDCLEERLADAKKAYEHNHRKLVAIQEELDWRTYAIFGLCNETEISPALLDIGLCPQYRPVEILLRRRIAKGEKSIFYDVHRYRGTGLPSDPVSDGYDQTIEERLRIIEETPAIKLIEQLDFKRRWQVEPWERQVQRALRDWMLDRLEGAGYWPNPKIHGPTLQSTAQLADKASTDRDFLQVAALYRARTDFDLTALVGELLEAESIPFLPMLIYKAAGLRRRRIWERTWKLQREQDAGKDVGDIPVPPKYSSTDFIRPSYYRLRGTLDVPKERWISYPHCATDSDSTLVVGWAGWNHLEQATALVAYYDARKREGWNPERLKPLLAGLDQLIPWIHQWHPEVDPDYGDTAGQSFQKMLESDVQELGLTLDDVRNWTPPMKQTKASKKKAKV